MNPLEWALLLVLAIVVLAIGICAGWILIIQRRWNRTANRIDQTRNSLFK